MLDSGFTLFGFKVGFGFGGVVSIRRSTSSRQASSSFNTDRSFIAALYCAYIEDRMAHPKGKAFVSETVRLDGETFDNCTFTDCTLIFSGGLPPNINNCVFQPPVSWNFDGAASNTLTFIQMLTSLSQEGAVAVIAHLGSARAA